jgi:hypothetical protein
LVSPSYGPYDTIKSKNSSYLSKLKTI